MLTHGIGTDLAGRLRPLHSPLLSQRAWPTVIRFALFVPAAEEHVTLANLFLSECRWRYLCAGLCPPSVGGEACIELNRVFAGPYKVRTARLCQVRHSGLGVQRTRLEGRVLVIDARYRGTRTVHTVLSTMRAATFPRLDRPGSRSPSRWRSFEAGTGTTAVVNVSSSSVLLWPSPPFQGSDHDSVFAIGVTGDNFHPHHRARCANRAHHLWTSWVLRRPRLHQARSYLDTIAPERPVCSKAAANHRYLRKRLRIWRNHGCARDTGVRCARGPFPAARCLVVVAC